MLNFVFGFRTGKSFLLNRLLGRQDGFAIGSTINPCTKGAILLFFIEQFFSHNPEIDLFVYQQRDLRLGKTFDNH
jgi:hypothetical protein